MHLVFCTSHIDSNISRYQEWIDYYTNFFLGYNVQLMLINDGPYTAEINARQAMIVPLTPHLGRQSVWIFPGWRRSFRYGVLAGRSRYQGVGHIESDCYIKMSARQEYMKWLTADGYYSGFCKAYNFPETALQILNTSFVKNYYIDRYAVHQNLYENIDFEAMVLRNLKPRYILDGDRYEGVAERFKPEYTFLSGIVYSDFARLHGIAML